MAMWEGKAKTSSPKHTEHEKKANTTRPGKDWKTELTTYIW